MKRSIINIPSKSDDVINIIPIFDLHILHPTFDRTLYSKVIDFIKNTPNTYWFGGGDYGEYINIKDKRFDPSQCYPDLRVKDLIDIVAKEIEVFG